MIGDVIVNNVSLRQTFHVEVYGRGDVDGSERDLEYVSVQGRSGDVVQSRKRLKNRTIAYPAGIVVGQRANLDELRDFLASIQGYVKISDTFRPEEYREGVPLSDIESKTSRVRAAEQFTLRFNVKPQRFLVVGDTAQTFTSIGTINNPYYQASRPLITVSIIDPSKAATFAIGAWSVRVNPSGHSGLVIDSEDRRLYWGGDPMGEYTEVYKSTFDPTTWTLKTKAADYPELVPGNSTIQLGSNVSQVEIVPRWWRN